MTIAMPTEPGQTVDSLARTLTRAQWDQWIAGLAQREGALIMPKFTITYGTGLKGVLANLGMGITYCDGQPDFTNLDPSGRACISDVQHKTFVQVDEVGTEAAAVTSVEIGVTSAGPSPLRIDRPFIFAIRERLSGTILFMGVVRNPAAE
jgi:serpin B